MVFTHTHTQPFPCIPLMIACTLLCGIGTLVAIVDDVPAHTLRIVSMHAGAVVIQLQG